MLLRVFAVMLACASAAWANEDDHALTRDNLLIEGVALVALDGDATDLRATLTNNSGADIILRKVLSNKGDIVVEQKLKLFGRVTWRKMSFLQINKENTIRFDGDKYRLVVGEPLAADQYLAFGFDFGPKGKVYYQYPEPRE